MSTYKWELFKVLFLSAGQTSGSSLPNLSSDDVDNIIHGGHVSGYRFAGGGGAPPRPGFSDHPFTEVMNGPNSRNSRYPHSALAIAAPEPKGIGCCALYLRKNCFTKHISVSLFTCDNSLLADGLQTREYYLTSPSCNLI